MCVLHSNYNIIIVYVLIFYFLLSSPPPTPPPPPPPPTTTTTGKEANVYYANGRIDSDGGVLGMGGAVGGTGEGGIKGEEGEIVEFAIKIYKTSILVFKDRDRYVSGKKGEGGYVGGVGRWW